ncbi:MAG: response regulator [Candidatus Krumholzibacteria bacterium]|nr:response regulator [Candidatus Krumholzibacteria bacterium]
MNQTILSVDDEPHMLKLLERIITDKTPYQITTTSNSLEVPELLEANTYDLILADLKMPGLDGMDILRLTKEQDRFEEVIMITAFGTLESASEALSLGVFDYITKPFTKSRIITSVNRAMNCQKFKREAARMQEVIGAEPFEEALKLFEREYLRFLSDRSGGDVAAMAERSGMPPDRISVLKEEYTNHERTD